MYKPCIQFFKIINVLYQETWTNPISIIIHNCPKLEATFPDGSVGKESACNAEDRRHGFSFWVGKISWKRKQQPTPVLLPEKSHGHRSLEGCSPWGCKELGTTERLNLLTCVRLFATPWTVAHQAPLSMKFSRQEYWNGLPFPFPGIFPTQGSNSGLLHHRQILYCLSHQGSHHLHFFLLVINI